MKCHEVDHKLIGDDMQIVEVELEAGGSRKGEGSVLGRLGGLIDGD